MTAAFIARDPADYARRLAIVVPYRDRPDHLARFLPHIAAYIERDKLDCAIRYTVHIVEQLGAATFNRGAVKNAGFLLARASADYVCFHDVDYLPLWADYSFVRQPARLIWHGLDPEPDRAAFLGGVIAFNLADFERVNGYSNDYWEWGYEDDDLRERCRREGLEIDFRDGTFSALPHAHHGLAADGTPTAASQASARTFTGKLLQGAAGFGSEGLSTLRFRVVVTLQMQRNGIAQPHLLHHKIELL